MCRMKTFTRADYQHVADYIAGATQHRPTVGLILGSGLGGLADSIQSADIFPYEQIPLWPQSTVKGHQGKLVIGTLEGQTVMALQGRFHFYEGYSAQEVTLPVQVMQAMGLRTLIVTNAAGGINKAFRAGDLMLINDQISLAGITGHNPLIGPNDDELGERFPSMTYSYDKKLRQLAHQVAEKNGFTLHDGVYVWLSGPMFETPAEIRMLRALGADAVGMSTAPEVIVARHAGMRVMGVSSITNECVDTLESDKQPNHLEVLEIGKTIVPRMTTLLRGVLASMDSA